MLWPRRPAFRQDAVMHRARRPPALIRLVLACTAACLAGCGEDARGLVESMGRAYRAAAHYGDDARLRIVRTRGDGSTEETHPFRVAFARPDKIRIEAYDARIVAAGGTLRAAVGGIPGQVLTEDVKSPLGLDQLFADRALRATLAEGEAGCPTQLPLLLADDTVDLILGDARSPPRIVGTETVDGHACARVEIPKPDGTLELWIDRRTKLLRRMKVPTDAYADQLARRSGTVTGVSVVVDFVGASFAAAPPAEAFTFEVPAGANAVPRLEPLRPPRPVSPLVGRRAPAFAVTVLDGKTLDLDALGGTPAVLEFFFTGCEPATRTMPEVAAGIARFRDARRAAGAASLEVRHLAVSVDEADVDAAALRRQLAEYGGVGTLARDPRAEAAEALGVREFPATVILGGDGTVADVIVGEDQPIAADVAVGLAAPAAGDDVARLVRDRHATRLREYKDRLAQATGDRRAATEPSPATPIAPRRQPVRFKLARAWRAADVALPGNLVCLDAAHGGGDEPRIVVLDGWREVVEIDAAGAMVGRHELAIPAGEAVRFLRTAVDGTGRRWWLGGTRGGRQVFVFDADWKLHATYPPPEAGPHDGISTAQLLDTDGDGTPKIVLGFVGARGVEGATLDGRRLWQERSAGAVLDLAGGPSGDDARGLLCVTSDGRILPLSRAGRAGTPFAAGAWRLRSLATGPVAPDGHWAAIGLAGTGAGHNVALGIEGDGQVAWELPLADGVHRDATLEPIAWADLLGTPRRQWLIAAPDGAVTVAWADGRVVDTYRHGAAIAGLGGYRHAGDGFIVIATRTALEAFRMEDIALD
jgi:outer membrane lipoprotein-sorting protein/peroxiredoxin